MNKCLILNNSGKRVVPFMGNILSFTDIKELGKNIGRKITKFEPEDFVARVRSSYNNLVVVEVNKLSNLSFQDFQDANALYKHIENSTWSIASINLMSSFLKDIKIIPYSVPLSVLVEPILRQKVISRYYTKNILPNISKGVLDWHDAYYGNASYGHKHIKHAYSIISTSRPNLLNDYKKEARWVKVANTTSNIKFLEEHLSNSLGTAWFFNVNESIDVFTDRPELAHMMSLLMEPGAVIFSEDITPLICQLKSLELLDKF